MKALSLTQPYASLVCLGEKQYETRGWHWTPRPLEIFIHAAMGFPQSYRQLCSEEPFKSVLARHGYARPSDLPLGCIIGKVRIVRSFDTSNIRDRLSEQELEFGDYSKGRVAIELADPILFRERFRCKGALGLWDVSPHLAERINEHLKQESEVDECIAFNLI